MKLRSFTTIAVAVSIQSLLMGCGSSPNGGANGAIDANGGSGANVSAVTLTQDAVLEVRAGEA